MSRLPILKRKIQVRFSNPLAGHVYNNTKYQQSCFFEKEEENQWQQLSPTLKSKSVANYSFKKEIKIADKSNFNSEAHSTSLLNNKFNIMESKLLNPVKRCSKHSRKISETHNPQKQHSLQRSKTTYQLSDKNKPMRFSKIEVKVLQSIQKDKEYLAQFNQKQFVIHLGRYFELYFKNNLQGAVFQELGMFVQSRIQQIINQQEKIFFKQNIEQNYSIKNKRALYQKLVQLEKNGNKYLLKQLLFNFCIPPLQSRQIFLNDLMSMISHKLYERFNFNKNERYVLLTDNGKVIKDFAQIKFSTKKLFVAVENQLEALLQEHFNQLKNQKVVKQKCSFRQTLKNHFRSQLSKGFYDENQYSNKSFSKQKSEKRLNLDRAEKILNLKNQKHCQGRIRIKKIMQISRKKKDNHSSQQINRDTKQPIKFDKRILSTDERIMTEFKRFKRFNDYQNAQFKNNENNRNKVQFGIIARESPYFKNKSQNQIQRIFSSLPFISPTNKSNYENQTITDEQYIQLRKIIACLAGKQSIISFVDRYLCFDEYGQLQKENLKQILLFVIGESKTSDVILLTVWSWLQKNGVILNDSVSRGNMQHLYERNKIVYYFLISLIFGTNETTALDLAEDII